MPNQELAEQAMANRPEDVKNLENETFYYGGETMGRAVEALSSEEQETARDMVLMFGSHIERKYNQDPESLSKPEIILLNLRNKPAGEAYTPHEIAGLYLATRYMEGQLQDPESSISQERNFGKGDAARDAMRDGMLTQMENLQGSMFWKLTGLDKDRGLEVPKEETGKWAAIKKLDGNLRAASRRNPNNTLVKILGKTTFSSGGESIINRALKASGGEGTKSSERLAQEKADVVKKREQFVKDHPELLLINQDVEKTEGAAWKVILDDLVKNGEITRANADAIMKADDAEKELRTVIKGRGSTARRAQIVNRVNHKTVDLSVERHYVGDLDKLAQQAAERSLISENERVDIEESLDDIDDAIKQKQQQLSNERGRRGGARPGQEKKIQDEITALEARRAASEAILKVVDGKAEKQLRKRENKSVEKIAKLYGMQGQEKQLEKHLMKELDAKNPAELEKKLKQNSSLSLFALIMQIVYGMSKG